MLFILWGIHISLLCQGYFLLCHEIVINNFIHERVVNYVSTRWCNTMGMDVQSFMLYAINIWCKIYISVNKFDVKLVNQSLEDVHQPKFDYYKKFKYWLFLDILKLIKPARFT